MLKRIVCAGLCGLSSFAAMAGDPLYDNLPLSWQGIVTVSGGPAWTTPGQNLYLYPERPIRQIDHYIYNSKSNTIATGEVFFGLQRVVFPGATGEFGIGLAGSTDAQVTGTVTVNGVPNFGTYSYKVDECRTVLRGKLSYNPNRVQPYITGSFGPSWNNSHDFRATTIDPTTYFVPWFSTNTEMGFAYTLGLGVQGYLTRHWMAGIGYEFADWGKSRVGVDATTNIVGTNLDHLYTNELVFSLSYLI